MIDHPDIIPIFMSETTSDAENADGQNWLALGVDDSMLKQATPSHIWTIIDPWRPSFLKCQQAGFQPLPKLDNENGFAGAYIKAGKHKARNHIRILEALQRLAPKATLVITGEKTTGIDSLRRWCTQLAPIQGYFSKNHGKTFWLKRPDILDQATLASLYPASQYLEGQFLATPGTFSYRQIDKGSALLASFFQNRLSGHVADFGAGWGYLSVKALEQCNSITKLDLYEADIEALDAAKANLAAFADRLPIGFHWHDITQEVITQQYDAIICNPPFHEHRAKDVALGQNFIRMAATTLKKGRHLYLVANRQLPYENVLKDVFAKTSVLSDEKGFKVITAQK